MSIFFDIKFFAFLHQYFCFIVHEKKLLFTPIYYAKLWNLETNGVKKAKIWCKKIVSKKMVVKKLDPATI